MLCGVVIVSCYLHTAEGGTELTVLLLAKALEGVKAARCPWAIGLDAQQEPRDFFAVGIHKDGLPWVFLPDCPGTGDPEEQVFAFGGGWARGYIWTPADFDARLARCNVTFEEGARYSIVGYGLEPVPFAEPTAWSEIYVLTDEIDIQLLR